MTMVWWHPEAEERYEHLKGIEESGSKAGISLEVYDLFFSSRRRHTRCSRDWSSDVCSSDLVHSCSWRLPSSQNEPATSTHFILHSTKQTADKADPELPGETGFVALDAHPMHQRHEVRNALGRQLFKIGRAHV